MSREIKVGLLVLAALVVLMVGTFLIGEKSNLFTRKNSYFVRFETVSGLSTGSPVQLNGVNVGDVTKIVLPRNVTKTLLTVWVSVDRDYQGRIRTRFDGAHQDPRPAGRQVHRDHLGLGGRPTWCPRAARSPPPRPPTSTS